MILKKLAPLTPRLGKMLPSFPNARMGNGFSDSMKKTLTFPFAKTLMPATIATKRAAPILAPCGIGPSLIRNPPP